ncbi:MAG: LPS export ABC transporter periplasmic protein LptC [Burkholderiaceae bacterium]|nr:LPS export ABC transporter periplasmic protein LptC [Burkholderiaceae bacterium]
MKERFATVFSLLIMVTLVIGTWWAADYSQRAVAIDPPARKTHEPDSWSKNFVLLRTNPQGEVINRLEGDLLEHFPDDDSYDVEMPRAFGLRADAPLTLATSRKATLYDDGDRIVMRGDAVLLRLADATHAPLNFLSDEIVMLIDKDISYTDLPATAISGRSRMSGIGMRYNNATQQLDVLKSTNVEIAPKDTRENSNSPAPRPKP